jgi:hypothetical protein
MLRFSVKLKRRNHSQDLYIQDNIKDEAVPCVIVKAPCHRNIGCIARTAKSVYGLKGRDVISGSSFRFFSPPERENQL